MEFVLTKSTIKLVKNVTFHSHSKHIVIHFHYIHKVYNDRIIDLKHHGMDNMPANMFTKALIYLKLEEVCYNIFKFCLT